MNKLIELDELKLELKKTQKLYLEALSRIDKAIDFLNNNTMIGHCKEHTKLLEILGGTNEHRNR